MRVAETESPAAAARAAEQPRMTCGVTDIVAVLANVITAGRETVGRTERPPTPENATSADFEPATTTVPTPENATDRDRDRAVTVDNPPEAENATDAPFKRRAVATNEAAPANAELRWRTRRGETASDPSAVK
jgi:hypothetical protein